MHIHNLDQWQHKHNFNIDARHGEKNTRRVILLTFFMMVIEIIAGFAFGSMALLADGWHMGTHVAALGITALAYWYARRHADDPRYSFGTGKVGILDGFASAVALVAVALMMAVESQWIQIVAQTVSAGQTNSLTYITAPNLDLLSLSNGCLIL